MTDFTHLPHPLGSYAEDAPVHCDSAACDWSAVGPEALPCLHGLPTSHRLSHPSQVATRKICLHKTRNGSSKSIHTHIHTLIPITAPLTAKFLSSPLQLDGEGEGGEVEEGEFGEYVETTAPY